MAESHFLYDLVSALDVRDAHKIEIASFPPEEAGSLEKFQYRQAHAPQLFLGAYVPSSNGRKLIGYICSTLSNSDHLTHESMSEHIPAGSSVCVHAVCVAEEYRRKGAALGLLKEYITRLQYARRSGVPYDRILLITHENMRSLYEKAGFEWLGKSEVVHGPEPWYEMRKVLGNPISSQPAEAAQTPSLPPGLWDALQRSNTRKAPVARLFSAFAGGAEEIAQSGPSSATNKFDLLCPREGCGSIILKNDSATLVERKSIQIEPDGARGGSSILPLLPPPGSPAKWWRVTPNAMAFENIGFSRSVALGDASKRLKLLICAECDLGPLGWCEEGGSEFWLAIDRVGYRE